MVARATDLITVTRAGHSFKASRRTVAHLDKTFAAFAKRFPHAKLVILQTCYHDGSLSAGTHDYDAVFDFGFTGVLVVGGDTDAQWARFSRFFRSLGWGGWPRRTGTWAAPSMWHYHGFSLPIGLAKFATTVGLYIDGGASLGKPGSGSSQLEDYLSEGLGLAGQHQSGCDHTWRPYPISSSVFRYLPWVALHGIPRNGSVK